MLNTITYPTKGEEKIDYEYNRYRHYLTKRTDSFAWDTNMATYDAPLGGVRVKHLTLHDPVTKKTGNVRSTTLTLRQEWKVEEPMNCHAIVCL